MAAIRQPFVLLLLSVILTVTVVNGCTYFKKGELDDDGGKLFEVKLRPYQLRKSFQLIPDDIEGRAVAGVEVAVCAPRASRIRIYYSGDEIFIRRVPRKYRQIRVPVTLRFHVYYTGLTGFEEDLKSGVIGITHGVCED